MGESRTGAEHHMLAAEHHEHAARHHRQASKHYEEKDFAHAAHESLIAHDHTRRAIQHSNEAGKYYVERHGDAKLWCAARLRLRWEGSLVDSRGTIHPPLHLGDVCFAPRQEAGTIARQHRREAGACLRELLASLLETVKCQGMIRCGPYHDPLFDWTLTLAIVEWRRLPFKLRHLPEPDKRFGGPAPIPRRRGRVIARTAS